jgi:hypothetical protein
VAEDSVAETIEHLVDALLPRRSIHFEMPFRMAGSGPRINDPDDGNGSETVGAMSLHSMTVIPASSRKIGQSGVGAADRTDLI